MNEKEQKSIEDGNLVFFEQNGIPSQKAIYFVWYMPNKNDKYRVLIKTFNTDMSKVKSYLNNIRNVYAESGLGKWNLFSGQCSFMRPSFF